MQLVCLYKVSLHELVIRNVRDTAFDQESYFVFVVADDVHKLVPFSSVNAATELACVFHDSRYGLGL